MSEPVEENPDADSADDTASTQDSSSTDDTASTQDTSSTDDTASVESGSKRPVKQEMAVQTVKTKKIKKPSLFMFRRQAFSMIR